MTAIEQGGLADPGKKYSLSLDLLQRAVLWLMILVSWIVFIEPAPYEYLFVLVVIMYLPHGMTVTKVLVPLIVFLFFYNLGGAFAVVPHSDSSEAVQFVAVSFYMGVTAIVFAFICSSAPLEIIPVIRNAYILGAVMASICGLIGYFNVAGMGETWAYAGRAQGTFKDPNVFSTYLILPAIFLIHGLVSGTQRWKLPAIVALLIILAGNFFAFSRGAWFAMFLSTIVAMGLTFLVTPSLAVRSRIVLYAIAGTIAAFALLAFALSFDDVRLLFTVRAQLIQSYDGGETGRFAIQLNSIAYMLDAPNGLGPFVFRQIFGQDPHNVYLNAFAAYGWLGGLSYLLLMAATIAAGWRAIFTRTPWQAYSIVVFSVLFVSMLQGVQIDTDHWRHFYLELGLLWGLYAATESHLQGKSGTPTTV